MAKNCSILSQKSSSLCLYSSNLGTFWLKIEQIWPFEDIFIFSNSSHLGYRTALTDTILKGDHLRIISAKFGWNWLSSFRGEDFFLISSPLFSNLHNRSCKHVQHVKIYLPCNFEVNLITHLGVIALFSSFFFFYFNIFCLIFQKLFRDRCLV
jgi:hypothetical protein